jgi:hypothetical protein
LGSIETENKLDIKYCQNKGIITFKQSIMNHTQDEKDNNTLKNEQIEYEFHVIGPPCLLKDINDSTGAGDAFIAGYLWSKIALSQYEHEIMDNNFDHVAFQMRMASWVAGTICE